MKKLSKPLSLLLSFLMVFSLFTVIPVLDTASAGDDGSFVLKAGAKEVFNSGYCGYDGINTIGQNLTYEIDTDGVLTISGTGRMFEASSEASAPFANDLRITSVVIEEGVTSIGAYAFSGCTNIVSVELPDSISMIGFRGFDSCSSLTSIDIPEGVTEISANSFQYCSSLTDVTLPSTLTSIQYSAFFCCTSLESIDLPEGLTQIANYAFRNTALTSITIPQNITVIPNGCFQNTNMSDIVIPDHVTTVENDAFSYMNVPIHSITIGANTVSFGLIRSTRTDNTITEFSFPDHVESFGGVYINSIQRLTIGKTLRPTGSIADTNNGNLMIEIDPENPYFHSYDNVIYNEDYSKILWIYASREGRITFPKELEEPLLINTNGKIYKFNYYDVEAGSQYLTSVDGVLYSKDMTILYACPAMLTGTVNIPETVTTIYRSAFEHTKVEIVMNQAVETIQDSAFAGTNGTDFHLILPESLKTIGDAVFNGCNYRKISLPEASLTISATTFAYSYIKEVYLGAGTYLNFYNTSTGFAPFGNYLQTITVSEDNQNYSSYDGAVYSKNLATLLYVPPKRASLNIPKETTALRYLPVPTAAITVDSENTRYKMVNGIFLTSKDGATLYRVVDDSRSTVTIPDGVIRATNIRSETDFKALNLRYVSTLTFPEGFNYIDQITGSSIRTLNIPSTLKSIKLNGTSSLSTLNLSDGFESLETLHGCNSLTNLTLPKSCKYVHVTSEISPQDSKLRNIVVNNPNCIIKDWRYITPSANISAYCGSPAHQAAVKRNASFTSLGHDYLDWYVSTPATYESEGVERRDCAYCDHYEERPIPKLVKETNTATFMADGKVVSVVNFTNEMSSIEEPPVPAKDRYLGEWEDYTLGDEDLVINAVYTLIKAEDAEDIKTESDIDYYYDTDDILFNIKASSAAKTVKSTISQSIPLDIVLVVDQSGSMEETLGSSRKKVDALKDAASSFINQVSENARLTGADHRIAIVGFGLAGNYNGYQKNENTELLTNAKGTPIVYHEIKTEDYQSALLNVKTDKTALDTAVSSIEARGATAADLGLEMAKSIYANTDSTGRERVVIFMTDGEPTYTSSFQTTVANTAIANASVLKGTYDASVYSLGVFQSATSNINKFMNAVSSDYPNATSMTKLGEMRSEAYCSTVSHTDALSDVFHTITTESLSHTAAFDKLTLIKTLSEYVTLTSTQEQNLRVALIRKYGVTNDDIVIDRKDDGTTEIKISNLTPIEVDTDGVITYEVSVSFFASLNQNATSAGEYMVDTEDSGIMLGDDANGYEATFAPSSVTLESRKTRTVYKINNEVYDITENGAVPETNFPSDWVFSGWTGSTTEKTATLTKAMRTITWVTFDGSTVQEYSEGDVIIPPNVSDKSDDEKFLSWNKSIPTVMPDQNLEFTAVYGGHVHKYISEVVTQVTCETDGEIKYVCACSDTYTETVPALGHNYEAVTSEKDKDSVDASKCTFVCTHCGQKYDYALNYQVREASSWISWSKMLFEFDLADDDVIGDIQPDGSIKIRIPMNDLQYMNAKNVYVTRTENGRQIHVPSVIEDGYLVITADHFSPYEITFISDDGDFIVGDTDGDGEVTILDVTEIQRYLASFTVQKPERVHLCGDITGDGIDILDATLIQRYLAGYTDPNAIGDPLL